MNNNAKWNKMTFHTMTFVVLLMTCTPWSGNFTLVWEPLGFWVICCPKITPYLPILHVALLSPDYLKIHVAIPGNISNFLVWCSPFPSLVAVNRLQKKLHCPKLVCQILAFPWKIWSKNWVSHSETFAHVRKLWVPG